MLSGFIAEDRSSRVWLVMAELRKVAHIMRRFVPEKWGGTESVVFNVSRELIKQGIESSIFCTDMFVRPGRQTLGNVPIRRFRYLFPWFGLSEEAKAKLRLKGGSPLSLPLFFGLLREKNLSVIHTHVQHRLGGMARTVAWLKNIPLVVSIHGGHFTVPDEQIEKMTEPFRGKREWGKAFGWLFGARRVLNDASAIVCVGKNEYREVKRRYPFKNVFHVPNGVDVDRFASAEGSAFRAAYAFQPSEKIVLCVSRIDYQKNQLGLVRAFSRFAKDHPDHRLVLIGAVTVEDYHKQVLAEIDKLGLKGAVRVIPGLASGDPLLPSAYKAAEIFVMAPHHEPFGIVILEAWAAGVPVVAYAVGGIPGFAFDRENSLLVEPDNEAQLVDRMAELVVNDRLRTELSERAYTEASNRYDWPLVAAQMQEIYRRISRD
jgi:glycosyltransferase involved in cell wall biosynthesis